MDAKTVRNTIIKPKLIDVFGTIMGNSLLTKAISAGLQGGSEEEKLKLMVDVICADPKVLGMWGEAHVQKQKQAWMSALK
jgi:hypothetical protein